MTDDTKSWKDEKKKIAAGAAAADDKKAKAKPDAAEKSVAAAKPEATAKADDTAKQEPVAQRAKTAKEPQAPQAAAPAANPIPPQPAAPQTAAQQPSAPQFNRQQVDIDDSEVNVCYANFCRVTGTPEELIIDFGLNTQPYGVPVKGIKVRDRIVTNMYTAKRLLHALHMTIQRHETAFGVLETDVQKRVVATPPVGQAPRS